MVDDVSHVLSIALHEYSEGFDSKCRPYIRQIPDLNCDHMAYNLICKLLSFQRRSYQQNAHKAYKNRRIIVGARETARAIKAGKVKAIIVPRDLQDEILADPNMINLLADQRVIFALTRRKLGLCLGGSPDSFEDLSNKSKTQISSIAIINDSGATEELAILLIRANELEARWFAAWRSLFSDQEYRALIDFGWLSLCFASFGQLELIKEHILEENLLWVHPETGNNIVQTSIVANQKKILDWIVASKPEIFEKLFAHENYYHQNVLHAAANISESECWSTLFEWIKRNEASLLFLHARDIYGYTPLGYLIASDNFQVVESYLKVLHPRDVSEEVLLASSLPSSKYLKMFQNANYSFAFWSISADASPLLYAAKKNARECLAFLEKYFANIGIKANDWVDSNGLDVRCWIDFLRYQKTAF